MTVRQALADFYQAHDFGEDGGINEKWFYLKFGLFEFPLPNTEGRKKIIHLHDIHHLINGYDTSWKGEVAVSGWEVATGNGPYLLGWLLSLWAMGYGLLLYPKYVYQGFRRGLRSRSVIGLHLGKEALFEMTMEELQKRTYTDRANDAPLRFSEKLRLAGWSLVSLIVFFVPLLLITGAILLLL